MFYFHISGHSTPSRKDIYSFKWSHVCIHAQVWPFPFLPSRKEKSTLIQTWENVANNKRCYEISYWDEIKGLGCYVYVLRDGLLLIWPFYSLDTLERPWFRHAPKFLPLPFLRIFPHLADFLKEAMIGRKKQKLSYNIILYRIFMKKQTKWLLLLQRWLIHYYMR